MLFILNAIPRFGRCNLPEDTIYQILALYFTRGATTFISPSSLCSRKTEEGRPETVRQSAGSCFVVSARLLYSQVAYPFPLQLALLWKAFERSGIIILHERCRERNKVYYFLGTSLEKISTREICGHVYGKNTSFCCARKRQMRGNSNVVELKQIKMKWKYPVTQIRIWNKEEWNGRRQTGGQAFVPLFSSSFLPSSLILWSEYSM